MSGAIEFDRDLYRGTAEYYDRFRVRYPRELMVELVDCAQPSGGGRLLDLACGTGQIAFAIAEHFDEVWAVDQEPDMISVVRDKAQKAGVQRMQALVSSAEGLDAPANAFELVAIGDAFHRLRRDTVAANALRWLKPGRCIALLWSTDPANGETDWQRALSDVLARWTARPGAKARVPAGWEQLRRERPDAAVLRAAGFQPVRSTRFLVEHDWTIDALLGYVYSTSALPQGRPWRARRGIRGRPATGVGRARQGRPAPRDHRLRLRTRSPSCVALAPRRRQADWLRSAARRIAHRPPPRFYLARQYPAFV